MFASLGINSNGPNSYYAVDLIANTTALLSVSTYAANCQVLWNQQCVCLTIAMVHIKCRLMGAK